MLLKLTSLIATIGAGFGLGRTKFRVNVRVAILTGLLAVVAQAGLRLVLPHDAIEEFAQSHLDTTGGQIVLMALAGVETAGLLLLVALMPWTDASSRAWSALYLLGAAFGAAAAYYFPFDTVIVNGEVIGPTHAAYELDLLVALPFGILGYVIGWRVRRRRRFQAARAR